MTSDEIQVDYTKVENAVKGDKFSIKVNEKIRPSDKMFVLVEEKVKKSFS